MTPKRAEEMLAGGSLYWVIKHYIIVRQRLIGFEEVKDKDGKAMCRIHLDPELIRTKPRKKRPFQGWRYLEPGDAPADLDGKGPALSADLETALPGVFEPAYTSISRILARNGAVTLDTNVIRQP